MIVLPTVAQENNQDVVQQFNKTEFENSLHKLAPKEFSLLFAQKYKRDSLRESICLIHIENVMLKSEDLLAQFWGNYSLSYWNHDQKNFKKTIFHVDKLYEIAVKLKNDDLILSSLINKGDFYYDYGDYNQSMESYLKAIKIAKKIKSTVKKLIISKNIALLKIEVDDNQGAVELLEGTLEILKKEQSKKLNRLEVSIYIALTKSYLRLENYAKAEYYGNKGIALSDEYGDEDAKTYFYNFLGETNLLKKKYDESILYIDKAFEYANKIETSKSQLPFINLNIGKIHYYKGEYEKAIDVLEKIEFNQQQKNTNFFSLEDMYKFLGKSYKAIGDTEKSLFYFEKTNEVYTKNDKQQNAIGIEIIKKYDLQSLKEELSEAEKKTKKTQTILYVSIFLALFTVGGLVYFYKKREKKNQQKFAKILKTLEEEKELLTESVPLLKGETLEEKQVKESTLQEKNIETLQQKEVEIIDETKAKLLKKLQNFEVKELYLSKNSSLNEVAKKLKTNTSYLSKLVNAHKGKSFTAYITDLRVNYAIRRLKEDKKFRSYTIDSIAREIGFNRSESFSRAFKNKTGLYPSYYIKNLDNQNVE